MDLALNNRSITYFNDTLINQFINFVDVNQITTKSYLNHLKMFYKWLNDNQIKQPQREDIINYKNYLKTSNLTNGTKNQYLRAVKQFFKWLSSEDYIKIYLSILKALK